MRTTPYEVPKSKDDLFNTFLLQSLSKNNHDKVATVIIELTDYVFHKDKANKLIQTRLLLPTFKE